MTRLLFACGLFAALSCAQNAAFINSSADADKAETALASHPEDINQRIQLLNYYQRQSSPRRSRHVVWMIENHPDHFILGQASGAIDKTDTEGFAAASAAWQKALSGERPSADAFANAIWFYRAADPARARQIVDDGLSLYPNNARIVEKEGMLLALSIEGIQTVDQYGIVASFDQAHIRSAEAGRDRKTLQDSSDPNLLGGAAQTLTGQVMAFHTRNLTSRVGEVEDLIVQLYQRAVEKDTHGRWSSGFMNAYQTFANATGAPAEKVAFLEKAVALANSPMQRANALPELARQYLATGNYTKANEAAHELLNADLDHSNWNYGNIIFDANMVLGRAALKQGDTKEAVKCLLAAGRTTSTPQLGSFGPRDWHLVEDLLGAGERDSVLAYLDELHGVWKNDNGRLDGFIATIRGGGSPNFTGPAEFPRNRYLGRPAPEFRLKNLAGAEVALSDFKGKVVIVDFWATWCGPCRAEMPEFQKIHRELADKDVVVLAVDVNEEHDIISEFIKKEKYTFPVLLANGTDTMRNYGVNAYPTTFFIDKNGLVADAVVGNSSDGGARINRLVEKALAGAPPPGPEPPPVVTPSRTTPASPASLPTATSAEDFFRDGNRQHTAKDYNAALKSFDRALDLRPEWPLAVFNRADQFYHLKRYDEAITGFSKAIQLDPKRAANYDARGLAYSYSNRHEQAIPDYTRAVELQPDFAAAFNNRGWAYMETGKLDQALPDFNRALEINPSYTMALFNRAHLFIKQKEYAKAVSDFDSILHVAPSDTQAANQKAAALRAMNQNAAPAAAALSSPKLLSPAAGAVFEHFPRDTTLVWNNVPGAVEYVVEWDYRDDHGWTADRGAPSSILHVTEPVANFRFVGAQSGRWRVWAVDNDGAAGPKSDWREFRYTK